MAVVMFVGAYVIPGPVLLLMLSVSVALSALVQWLVTAKNKRQLARRVIKAATLVAAVYIIWDCGWLADWLCLMI